MIISASRRTDIPTYYSDWFFNRVKDGYVLVRNPMNFHQVSRISLSPDVVDSIVFWTKNPVPFMRRLHEIDGMYAYYFLFTVNGYDRDIETNIPSKEDVIIPAFQQLSQKIGAERVIWRYDPILLTDKYSVDFHIRKFAEIAQRLSGYTEKCVISFVDFYKTTLRHTQRLGILPLELEDIIIIARAFSEIAKERNIVVETCCESFDIRQFNIAPGHCIDKVLLEKLMGCKLNIEKDKTQRESCGCMASIDIGMYNTCKNGCRYCYANYNDKLTAKNFLAHAPNSPLLCGQLLPDDIVRERPMHSCKDCQNRLF